MKEKIEYLIIGQGVAGSCLALKLLKENKSFLVIDENKNRASSVAVGIFNPVVLYRFALIWKAKAQLIWMHKYFKEFEKILGENYVRLIPTFRIFNNKEEIKTWQKKAEKPELYEFLSAEIKKYRESTLKVPYGYSEVKQTGRIDLGKCLNSFGEYLFKKEKLLKEKFEYNELKIKENEIEYKEIKADKIIFCEGYGVKKNPLFKYLPVIGVKGEVLKIKIAQEIPEAIWKGHNFLMPLKDNICFTASTYNREDLSYQPTEKGRMEIEKYLKEIYNADYEVLEHFAGIRPTVIDRRPILGNHPDYKHVFIVNGMGTRGTLLAPQMTEFLFDFMEKKKEITPEANIRRFDKLLQEINTR